MTDKNVLATAELLIVIKIKFYNMTNKKEQTKIIKKILRKVIDPELGIDIVSLGLIDKVVIRNNYIEVQMVFTFPGCPFMSTLLSQVRDILQEKFPDYKIEVKVLEKE